MLGEVVCWELGIQIHHEGVQWGEASNYCISGMV